MFIETKTMLTGQGKLGKIQDETPFIFDTDTLIAFHPSHDSAEWTVIYLHGGSVFGIKMRLDCFHLFLALKSVWFILIKIKEEEFICFILLQILRLLIK